MRLQNRNAQPLCAALDKVETVRVDIAGIQRAAVLHLQGSGKALAAGAAQQSSARIPGSMPETATAR